MTSVITELTQATFLNNTDVRLPRGTGLKTVFVTVCGDLLHI